MKRIIYLLMVCSILIAMLMPSVLAIAEDNPILKINIQADKTEYKKNEIAKLTITVENTSDIIAADVNIANILPNGLVYAPQQKQASFTHAEILPHTSVQHEVYVQVVDVQLPQTGDKSPNMFATLGIIMMSVVAFVVLRKKTQASL